MDIVEAVKLVGGLAGIVALLWKFHDLYISNMSLGVEIRRTESGDVTIFTSLENSSLAPKAVGFAMVFVVPHGENVLDHARRFCDDITCTEDLKKLQAQTESGKAIYKDNVAIIPLPFYYQENMGVGDEKLTFRTRLAVDKLAPNDYSVRFYIFPKFRWHIVPNRRYHRVNQDLLVLPPVRSEAALPEPPLPINTKVGMR